MKYMRLMRAPLRFTFTLLNFHLIPLPFFSLSCLFLNNGHILNSHAKQEWQYSKKKNQLSSPRFLDLHWCLYHVKAQNDWFMSLVACSTSQAHHSHISELKIFRDTPSSNKLNLLLWGLVPVWFLRKCKITLLLVG